MLLPFVVLYMLLTKYLNHYLGTTDIKTVEAVQCTFSCIIMITMHQYRIKFLSRHIHMYKMENKLLPSQGDMLQKHYLWDTVTINGENCENPEA